MFNNCQAAKRVSKKRFCRTDEIILPADEAVVKQRPIIKTL
jgi:hypothetical protein